jgi:L-threonylcarbamoyladenylate synthase
MVLPAAEPRSLPALVEILASGGTAIAPGDTMYGLIGIVPESEARIRRIKGRGEDKPFIQLVADAGWVARLSDVRIPERVAAHWPGPLTVVVPQRGGGTVALRVPDHPLLQRLLRTLGRPLYSTSVNRAGAPPLATLAEMRRDLEGEVDAIFDAGDQPPGAPSTLLDITRRPFLILRQGAVLLSDEDLA